MIAGMNPFDMAFHSGSKTVVQLVKILSDGNIVKRLIQVVKCHDAVIFQRGDMELDCTVLLGCRRDNNIKCGIAGKHILCLPHLRVKHIFRHNTMINNRIYTHGYSSVSEIFVPNRTKYNILYYLVFT